MPALPWKHIWLAACLPRWDPNNAIASYGFDYCVHCLTWLKQPQMPSDIVVQNIPTKCRLWGVLWFEINRLTPTSQGYIFLQWNKFTNPHNAPIRSIFYNTQYRIDMCPFLVWMAHCGIWARRTVSFAWKPYKAMVGVQIIIISIIQCRVLPQSLRYSL